VSPQRIALRTILLGRPRSVLAIVLIGASLSVLDLFAGRIASVHARLEHEAVMGERLGHLAIVRGGGDALRGFDAEETKLARALAEATPGVALVLPQTSVAGIASAGTRSALFRGEGIGGNAAAVPALPGKLKAGVRNGIAVSAGQADALGVREGSNVTLQAATPYAAGVPLKAEVVDVYGTGGLPANARPVLMPIELAQALQGSARTERLVVFLSEPSQLEAQRAALLEGLRRSGVHAEVRSWKELSLTYKQARDTADLAFDSVSGMVFAVIAAAIAATIAMNALERRRELGTLRALGMRSSGVFLMLACEALWMAAIGIVLSLMTSGLIAWIVNRAAVSATAHGGLSSSPTLVELDFNRMGMALVAVFAVALLAALVPAFKAARQGTAEALAS
jgi:putative ABC transport system permease protein